MPWADPFPLIFLRAAVNVRRSLHWGRLMRQRHVPSVSGGVCFAFSDSALISDVSAAKEGRASAHEAQQEMGRRPWLAGIAGLGLHLGLSRSTHGAEFTEAPRGVYVERFESAQIGLLGQQEMASFDRTPYVGLKYFKSLGVFRIDSKTKEAHRVLHPPAFTLSVFDEFAEHMRVAPQGACSAATRAALSANQLVAERTTPRLPHIRRCSLCAKSHHQ